jgi:hypothetical protein
MPRIGQRAGFRNSLLMIEIGHHHVRAFRCEPAGNAKADAICSTCNQRTPPA